MEHLGPSLDYNPDKLDYEAYPDGGAFDYSTCDHQQLDPEMVEEIHTLASNPVIEDVDEQALQQVILEDQGIDPPPWVRWPEIFNIPVEEFQEERAGEEPESEILTGIFRPSWHPEERVRVANPVDPDSLLAAHKRGEVIGSIHDTQVETNEKWGLVSAPGKFLSQSAKLAKGHAECYMVYGLNLLPWTLSGIANLCPYATKGCSTACLNISGQTEISLRGGVQDIIWFRHRATLCLFNNRPLFAKLLDGGIRSVVRKAERGDRDCASYTPCFRMNVLSDLPWESMPLPFDAESDHPPYGGIRKTVFERFPQYAFYDYTKNPVRMQRFLAAMHGEANGWPSNYYLTFSWSEINARIAFAVLDAGGNVAMPFDVNPAIRRYETQLPQEFCGYPVINADRHDMRFLDIKEAQHLRDEYGTGVICGLKFKGTKTRQTFYEAKAQEQIDPVTGFREHQLTGGFFQYADEAGVSEDYSTYDPAMNITNTPEYKAALIAESAQRAREQEQDPEGAKEREFRASPKWWRIGE